MQYNNVANPSQGLIQQMEIKTSKGLGSISGDTNLLQEFTGYANDILSDIWTKIFENSNGWRWDDSNQTDLPQGVINLVSGTNRYGMPTDALTIDRIEIKDAAGNWIKLTPLNKEKGGNAIADLEGRQGTPLYYFLVGDTIVLIDTPNYNSTGGLKVYFKRDAVNFNYDDVTVVPGFASPFYTLISLGASIEWLKINQPTSPSLPFFMADYEKQMDSLGEFYSARWSDNSSVALSPRRENME